MPNVNIHCKISKTRTGTEFRELHEWTDEPQKFLGQNHRIERHSFHEGYKEYIEEKWGKKAVIEWLFHIALDNLETANKFAFDTYQKSFDETSMSFEGKELSGCKFIKKFPNSNRVFEIDLKGKLRERKEVTEEEGVGYTKQDLLLMGFSEAEAEYYGDD